MKPPPMDELRKQGYKIKVTHLRVTQFGMFSRRQIDEENAKAKGQIAATMGNGGLSESLRVEETARIHLIQPCGGYVLCEMESPDGYKSEGRADCSIRENFKRKIGTTMAYGRAWKPFSFFGHVVEGAAPVGTDIQDKESKVQGTVFGSRNVHDPDPARCVEYVISWNADPKMIFCLNGVELETTDLKSLGAR